MAERDRLVEPVERVAHRNHPGLPVGSCGSSARPTHHSMLVVPGALGSSRPTSIISGSKSTATTSPGRGTAVRRKSCGMRSCNPAASTPLCHAFR